MVLALHIWGPAFGLPSIDAECIAATAYLNRAVPSDEWILIADYDPTLKSQKQFPALVDGSNTATGFPAIVSYLRKHHSFDLDRDLTEHQQEDKIAYLSFLQSTATPLVDLYLYVSSENYNGITSSAYTAILPWYLNYTVPPARRDLARARTAHFGLHGLDVNTATEEGTQPGSGTASSEFAAAKRNAGIPSSNNGQPKSLNLGRGKGIGGLLSSPIHAARFRLDALTNELLEPLGDLLGKKGYLYGELSSLDCLAFGYLSLMLYAPMPQAWLQEAIRTRFPRIQAYIDRMRNELLGAEEVSVNDVWDFSSGRNTRLESLLPWQPRTSRSALQAITRAAAELIPSFPIVSSVVRPSVEYQRQNKGQLERASTHTALPSPLAINAFLSVSAATAAVFVGMAIHHRKSPRDGDLIFWALRPNAGFGRFGEAGDILSVLAHQIPRV